MHTAGRLRLHQPSATGRRPAPGADHGSWTPNDEVLVRVHEPFTALDLLDAGGAATAWPLPRALAALQARRRRRGGAAELHPGRRHAAAAAAGPAASRPPRRAADGPAHLRRRRADPARAGRAPHEAAGQPAPHAQHGRLRPRGHRLRRPPDRSSHRSSQPERGHHARRRQGHQPANWPAKACASASCRPASTRPSPASWPRPAWPNWLRWVDPATSATSPCPARWRCRGAEGHGRQRATTTR
jgi:hypothetical protein